jgi:hypothetical protein
MVGRDRELARVTGLLDDALAGRGRVQIGGRQLTVLVSAGDDIQPG